MEYWDSRNPPPNLHIAIDDTFIHEWIEGYKADQAFSSIWADEKRELQNWKANGRFIKDERGLLYFVDPDYQPRLCVPKSHRNFVLREAHENPMESGHAG
ncbi:hypothetical protein K443DRAFT_116430, partial [Laccaria amethystina LaAM-08-1]